MVNIATRLPQRGDIVTRRICDRKNIYFKLSTFSLTDFNQNMYEIIGVVAWRFRDMVLVAFKKNVSKTYCARPWWYLSGYTLDGTERTGIISIRVATDSWDANVDKTITYNADNVEDFVEQLNTYFSTDDDMKSSVQDWYADVTDDGRVRVHCKGTDYRQYSYNTAKTGFSFTGGSMPEVVALANMKRKNGGTGGYGASGSFDRYVYYYESQPEATLTSQSPIKTTGYPVSKATYINSQYCSNLRGVYGEGRDGWIKYMKSCKPVRFTDYGNHGIHDGKERGKLYASFKYTSTAQTTETAMMAASDYCYNLPTIENLKTVDTGEFWLATTQELDMIMQDVKYGTSSSRDADVLNAGLVKISGTAISNGSYWWSCVRYSSNLAWRVYGSYGTFDDGYMCNGRQVVPVSIFALKN